MIDTQPLPDETLPLSKLTTLRVGGPPRRLVVARSTDELVGAVRDADAGQEPVLVLGGGSNLLVVDEGFPGVVVAVATRGLRLVGDRLIAAAGEPWDPLVAHAVGSGLAGLECLSGIPGLAGASPIQNVGAYGQEVADVITRVQAYDRSAATLVELTADDCSFGYRDSRFKQEPGRWVVTEVEFGLRRSVVGGPLRYGELSQALGVDPADPQACAPLGAVRDAVLQLRRSKGMVLDEADPDTASAGSFFTNPVLTPEQVAALAAVIGEQPPGFAQPDGRLKVPAAWLITRAGFVKGYGSGRARLSTKHPLALTNRGGASAAELLALAREVRDGVRERLGITLVNEPVIVGAVL